MNAFEEGSQPFVSIITLNYNQAGVTAEFLESCKMLLYKNFEILVCDMASGQDPSAIFSPSDYPNTKLLISKKNLGFAGGNNWGMRMAKGEYLFIVNNDTELTPDIIQVMLRPFRKDVHIGVVCPKIIYFYDPGYIQYAGFQPMNPFTGRTSAIGNREPDNGQYDVSGVTYGAHGCAMMVKKEVIIKAGMFPEKFFLYYEEWDLSARIQKAGYLIWYEAKATVFHKESMTVGRANPLKSYYLTRNRILYMRRNSSFFHLFVFGLFFGLFTLPKTVFNFLVNRQFTSLKWFLKAIGYNLTHNSKSAV
jgi:GT2 family glycosyltransferase